MSNGILAVIAYLHLIFNTVFRVLAGNSQHKMLSIFIYVGGNVQSDCKHLLLIQLSICDRWFAQERSPRTSVLPTPLVNFGKCC